MSTAKNVVALPAPNGNGQAVALASELPAAVMSFEHKRLLAASIVKSGMFGLKDEAQAFTLMALAEAEGLHPAKAVQEFHVIQGRPALKADAMLARFQRAGGSVQWTCYTDEKAEGTFSHPQGGSITIDWTIERAKKIGLAGKDNWKHYPRAMLRARCISEGVRTLYPGAASGVYTVEEIEDMPPLQVKDMPADISDAVEIVPPEPPLELLDQAAEAAAAGTDSYAKFWKATGADNRKLIGPGRHADFKSLAETV